jgi:ribonucleoside-diphosphate reductase alpha chain
MQAALQPYVDSSISKTINVPEDYPFEDFRSLYRLAYEAGLKGCTTFRPNPITGEVLKGADESKDAPHCCAVEREAD